MRRSLTSVAVSLMFLSLLPGRVGAEIPGLLQDDNVLCADVNGDGLINVLDIISTINYIMGGTPDPFNMEAADINTDGGINVLDIISMVNIILQVPACPAGASHRCSLRDKPIPRCRSESNAGLKRT